MIDLILLTILSYACMAALLSGKETERLEIPKPQEKKIVQETKENYIASKSETGKPNLEKLGEEDILFSLEEQKIISLPDPKDPSEINIRYALIPPYSYAYITWNEETHELIYNIEEPELREEEEKILKTLENGIKELINLSFIAVQDKKTILVYLEKNIRVLLTELAIELDKETFLKYMYYIYRDFVGLNEIEPLMNDYYIEDIECNGLNTPVYIVHRKYRNIKTNLIFTDIHKMSSFVEKLAQKCGKYVSYAEPLLDGSLPDGSRANATYSTDITSKGPSFTIRKFTKSPWGPIKLMQKGTASAEVFAYLWMAIEFEQSMMIIGGTGTGKTSFINAIAFFIPPQARVVSIEDTKELMLEHENWLPSVARQGMGLTNLVGERYGEVSLFDLLKESFRQRPDYVIVGEVRGKEAFVLFQGFASGHPGMATMHAESVETLIKRLETPPINLSGSLIMTLGAVVVMSQIRIKNKLLRKVTAIEEVIDVKEQLRGSTTNKVISWDPRTDRFMLNQKSKVFQTIAEHYGMNLADVAKEFQTRAKLLNEMYKRGIDASKQVQNIIHEYYKAPDLVKKRFGL